MQERSDEELKQLLQSSDEQQVDLAFRYLFARMHPQLSSFIISKNGRIEDVDDVLQEGLIVYYKKARQGDLSTINNLEHYLFTICKHLWHRKIRNAYQETELDHTLEAIPDDTTVLQHLLKEEREQLFSQILETLGSDCYDLLVYFYYDRMSIKEILVKMHYSSEAALKNKKSKCMKKLRELFDAIPTLKNRIQ